MRKLNESSLSRLLSKMDQNDTGTITAYRSKYTKKENQQRNKSLLAKLQNLRYGVTSVKGSYIENYDTPQAIEVGEQVFFVENMDGKGKLKEDLKRLGEEFEQDSILFIPKGGEVAYLIGTSKTNQYPFYGKEEKFDNRTMAGTGEFMTRVNGRPFIFESVGFNHKLPEGFHGRKGLSSFAKADWRKMVIESNSIFNQFEYFTKKVLKENWLTKKGYL